MHAGLVAHDLARARDHSPVPHSHPGSSSRYARPDLERSNTSTSFASFWLGKALGRKLSQQQQQQQQRVEIGREGQRHALRESRLVQVERLPRDDRIRAWALRREDEVGGLERWRREVAVEVERERRDEEEVLRRAREASASTTVRDMVAEAKGLLESSPFSTSFRVKSLALPPSPTASTDIASPPGTLESTVTPPTNLSHAVIATAELRSVARQDGLTPSTRQMPQPIGGSAQGQLAATLVATASSVADPHPTPAPSYRFPVPPTPPFSRLAPLETPPLSASISAVEPQPWTGTPPPRSSSLPFLDLLDAPLSPGAEAAGPPPECSLIPPKAAALLGLVPPAAASSLGGASSRPPFYAADLAAASATGALGRASIETTASSSFPTLPTSGGRPSLAHARAPHNTSTSSFAYSTTQPTSATGRKDSNASAAAATAAAVAATTKLSLDLTRGAPRLVVVPPTRPSFSAGRQRTVSSFAYSPAASHAKVPRKKPSFVRLRLHRGGMASLPDLHDPALQADSAAAARRSVRPVVQSEWRDSQHQQDHQASWYDGSSDESGVDGEEEIESILDAFYPPPAPPASTSKRERSLGSLRRRIGGSLRRKSSFRCCGDRIEAQQSHAAPSARTGEGAVKSLVRSLSRSRSKRAVRFAPAEDERTVRQREVRQARRRTREEWEFESAALAGRMDRHV